MRAASLASSISWLASARITTLVTSVGSIAVLARLLTPADFGVMAAVFAVVALATAVTDGACGVPLVQRERLDDELVRAAFWLSMGMAIGFAVLVNLFAPVVEGFFGFPRLVEALALISLLLPLKALTSISQALLQRRRRFDRLGVATAVSQIVGYAGPAVLLAYLGFGVWSLVFGTLAAGLLEAVMSYAFARFPLGLSVTRQGVANILRSAGPLVATRLFNWGGQGISNILIGKLLGAEALGIYSRASRFLYLATDLMGETMRRVLLPEFSRMQGEPERLASAFERVLRLAIPLYALVSLLTIIHAEAIVRILLGEAWLATVVPMQALFAAFLPRAGYKISETLAIGCGRFRGVAGRRAVFFGLVTLAVAFGSRYGLAGVAIGFASAVWLSYILSLAQTRRLVAMSGRRLLVLHLWGLLLPVLAGAVDVAVMRGAGSGFWTGNVSGGLAALILVLAAITVAPGRWIGPDLAALRGTVGQMRTRVLRRLRIPLRPAG